MGVPSRPLEERGRTTQRPRAEGQRTIQPTLGTTLALAPRRGGSGIGKAFERRADTPNAAPRARRRAERSEGTPIALQSPVGLARGASNDFHWTLGGLFSRNAPSGAGRGYRLTFRSLPKAAARAVLRSFFSVVVFRETKVGQSQRGKAPPDPTAASRRGRGDSFTFNLQTLASYCGRPGPWWFRFHLVARRRGGPYPLVLQPQFTRSTLGGPPRRRSTKLNSFQHPVYGSFGIHARL